MAKEPKFEVNWDDKSGGWRIGEWSDERGFEYLPPAIDGHRWLAGTAAAIEAAPGSIYDREGLLWRPSDDRPDLESELKKAADAATRALSPLSKTEKDTLKMISLLGTSKARKSTIEKLRSKLLVDERGRPTIAGKIRARS